MVTLLREPARPAAIREHPLAPWFAVATVCFGAFMGQLDASVVTVAFPALQRQFGTGLAAAQWVSLAYLLVLTALLVPAGRWSDRAGRKLLYLYGFVVFAVASAACGLAPSLGMLIALRVVQAGGAALLQANSVALVVTSVPARTRRAALGVQAAAQAVGLASGPVIGGVLVAAVGWRWVFFLNVPVGLLAVVAGWYLLPRTRRAGAARLGRWPTPGRPLAAHAVTPARVRPALGRPARRRPGRDGPAGRVDVGRHARHLLAVRARPARLGGGGVRGGARASAGAALVAARAAGRRAAARPAGAGGGGHRPGAAAARSAPTSSCSARWCCSRRWCPLGAAAPRRRACCSPRCRPGSASPRWSRTGCSRPAGRTGAGAPLGGALAAGCAAALAVPAPDAVSVVLLGLLGAGLGIYTPANNAEIMAAVPARDAAAAGGMVNMTRGIGTALGVAVVTLGLHAGALLPAGAGRSMAGRGSGWSMAALAAVALVGRPGGGAGRGSGSRQAGSRRPR